MFVPATGCEQAFADLQGCTVIVPAVGIGSIAQLAVDYLVQNIDGKCVGYLEHTGILPMVGSDVSISGDSGKLLTSAEVYYAEQSKLLLLHMRSPVIQAYRTSFRQELAEWLLKIQCASVLILTGANATERIESQLTGPQVRCLLSSQITQEHPALSKELASLGCPALETRLPCASNPDGVYIHGGGMVLSCPTLQHVLSHFFFLCIGSETPLSEKYQSQLLLLFVNIFSEWPCHIHRPDSCFTIYPRRICLAPLCCISVCLVTRVTRRVYCPHLRANCWHMLSKEALQVLSLRRNGLFHRRGRLATALHTLLIIFIKPAAVRCSVI
eukprot:m.78698 g.78698  ORF g.78698 m.78698 type:complete len:327 (+) comp16248_c1_seq13:303-1283(+)